MKKLHQTKHKLGCKTRMSSYLVRVCVEDLDVIVVSFAIYPLNIVTIPVS